MIISKVWKPEQAGHWIRYSDRKPDLYANIYNSYDDFGYQVWRPRIILKDSLKGTNMIPYFVTVYMTFKKDKDGLYSEPKIIRKTELKFTIEPVAEFKQAILLDLSEKEKSGGGHIHVNIRSLGSSLI